MSVCYTVTSVWIFDIWRFQKRAAKTPYHGHRYGNSLTLHNKINTHELFFCYNWNELCSSNKSLNSSIIYCFLVKYAIQISNRNELLPIPCYADMQRTVPADPGAGASSYWVMPSNTTIGVSEYFEIGPRQIWFIFPFLRRCPLWCSADTCGRISFITFWLFGFISAYLSIQHRIFRTLLTLDNYIYQTHEQSIMKFYLLISKHLITQLKNCKSILWIWI